MRKPIGKIFDQAYISRKPHLLTTKPVPIAFRTCSNFSGRMLDSTRFIIFRSHSYDGTHHPTHSSQEETHCPKCNGSLKSSAGCHVHQNQCCTECERGS